MMTCWSVLVEASAAATEPALENDAAAADCLFSALEGYSAAISVGNGKMSARMTIETGECTDAGERAIELFVIARDQCGLPIWALSRLEVMTRDDRSAELGSEEQPK